MPECTEQMLKKHMTSGDFSRVYVFYGAEKFLLAKAARKLMDAVVGDVFPDFNLQKFDGMTASVDQIAVAADALPFMAERKCVVVSDFSVEARPASEVSKLVEVMRECPESTVFLFTLPTLELDYKKSSKWRSFYKQVSEWADTVEFSLRTKVDLEKWLCAAAGRRNCQLSRGNAGYMVDQCGNDLQTLHHELEKLCAFVGEGEITRKHMDQVLTRNLETTVFLLARALTAGNYDKAYQIMDLLFAQREEPVAVLAALGSVYVDLYRVRAALQSGDTVSSLAKTFDYKGREFRLRNAERDGAGISLETLREYLDVLLETDAALKSTRTDNRLWMDECIARMLWISRKERMVLIQVKEAIIVEGKYDKIKLSSLVDGLILETHGFQIFKDQQQMALIRRLADTRGLVILTDSDAAGFVIRNYLNGSIDNRKIKHAYIPDVFGKEKRKEKGSKEGKLGVEGVDASLILDALRRAGATILDAPEPSQPAGEPIRKADLFAWGLSGQEDSAAKRQTLLKHLNLPEHLTANALVKVLGSILTREQCESVIEELFAKKS